MNFHKMLLNLCSQMIFIANFCMRDITSYTPREQSSGGYIGITLSVCLSVCQSVCAVSCPAHNFFLFWHWLTIFFTCIYHHERTCRVHSWSWFDIDLWPQGQIYRVYYMALCSCDSFFVLWHTGSHTMNSVWPWPLISISKLFCFWQDGLCSLT